MKTCRWKTVRTAADLHARLGVPYAKIADFLGSILVTEKQGGRSPVGRLAGMVGKRASPHH